MSLMFVWSKSLCVLIRLISRPWVSDISHACYMYQLNNHCHTSNKSGRDSYTGNPTGHWTEPSRSVYLHDRLLGKKTYMNNLTLFFCLLKCTWCIFCPLWTCCSVPVSAPWQMYTLPHPSASSSPFCPSDLCSFLCLSSHSYHTLSLSALYFFSVFSYYHSSTLTLPLTSAMTLSSG